MNFAEWKTAVNARLLKLVGADSDDLPDWFWRDSFDDGLTPNEAVAEFMNDMMLDEQLVDEF